MGTQFKPVIRDGMRLFAFSVLMVVFSTAAALQLHAQEIARFAVIGDYGSGDRNEEDVANLVKSWNPEFIITTGDNNYPDGEASTIDNNIGKFYAQFIYPYTGAYGPGSTSTNRFFPAMGNHDWDNNVGIPSQPYTEYFTLPGNERYYDFIRGPVHFFMVDSDSREPDGITSTSVQASWLRTRLAASTAQWKVVVLHHPPFSSRTSWPKLQWPYKEWGASVVLSGHAHVYERIIKSGLPYITNGLGGDSTGSFDTGLDGSVVRFGVNYGAMLVRVSNTSITFQFVTRSGVIIDTYTMGPDATVPNAPSGLAASTISNGQSTLSWSDNAINEDGYRIEQSTNFGSYIQVGSKIANETSFTVGGLSVGNIYSFRVRSVNNAGVSGYSNIAEPQGTTPSPPAAPSNVAATAVNASQINLSWTDTSSNETGFSVERCEGSSCTNFVEIVQTTADVASYQDGGRVASTTYRYRLRSFNGLGYSGYSNIAAGTTPIAGGPTEPPSNLMATAISSSGINLSWTDDSDNEDGFKIERCTGGGCTNFAEVARVSANSSGYSDTNLIAQSTYVYRVRAFAGLIDTAYSNSAQATTLSTQAATVSDDFNDGVRDATLWSLGILSRSSSSFDPSVSVVESGGRLVITPNSTVSGSRFGGYLFFSTWDMTGGRASVEAAQVTTGAAATVFSIGTNKDNWYGFRLKGSTLYLERRISGSTSSQKIKYNALMHRFWRIRHNATSDSIVYETSADGAGWSAAFTVARQISLAAIRMELIAGTTSSVASPGSAHFDNFLFIRN